MNEDKKNPVLGKMKRPTAGGGTTIQDWWPNLLNLDILHQHSSKSNPMDEDFNYAKEFNTLDFQTLKKDLAAIMTESLSESSKIFSPNFRSP